MVGNNSARREIVVIMEIKRLLTAALAVGLGMSLAACGGSNSGPSDGNGALEGATLTVGSKEFTESIILGKITALALENAGAKTQDKTGISGSATVRAALVSKGIDMYWDYTGTGWVNILGHTTKKVPKDLYKAVSTEDAKKNDIAWLKPAPFQNSYGIAVKTQFSDQHNVKTLSEAATYVKAHPNDGAICAASEFLQRDDGLPGLEKAYGFKFSKVVELDFNLVYPNVGKKCTFTETTTTDGRNISQKLTVLKDDQHFFVEYRGALTMRQETLDKYPPIADIMGKISAKLTDDEVTNLNSKVDVEGQQPEDVAKEWLKGQSLLS